MKKTIIFRVVFDAGLHEEFPSLQEANDYIYSILDEAPNVKEAKVLRIEQQVKVIETICR